MVWLILLLFLIISLVAFLVWRALPKSHAPTPTRERPDEFQATRILFADPEILLFEQFLTAEEIEHLKSIAEPRLRRSTIKSGQSDVQSTERTSESAMLDPAEDEIVRAIEAKCAALTGYSISHIEPLQVLRYRGGEHYSPHYDYFQPNELAHGGQRHGTLFIYLNDVENGGETWFPELDLSIAPKAGSAALWYNCDAHGNPDARLLHGAKPPVDCEKWGVNVWFRQSAFR